MLACAQCSGHACEDILVEQHMKGLGGWRWDIVGCRQDSNT